MPISFNSQSHGSIAVGFFNIETDLLLMDRYFMFASDFCGWVKTWASDPDRLDDEWTPYVIPDPDMIGNLAGAIYGFEYSGFIGEVYRRYPFPQDPDGFKQKPYGSQNRNIIEEIIQAFAIQTRINVNFSKTDRRISIGDYVFAQAVFKAIIGYVKAGGMPEWLNGKAPAYVAEMTAAVEGSTHPLFT